MKNIFKHISYFLAISMAVVACNKDDIPDPYQPVTLPKINQLNFISGNDSSIFIYDADMILTSGRDNTVGNDAWKESFVMKYQSNLLTGATYEFVMSGRDQLREVTYNRNDRNMLAKVTSEDSKLIFSLSYDDNCKLTQVTMSGEQVENRYNIKYNGDNVSSVEIYQKSVSVEGTTRMDFSDYDTYPNPFHFLVNTFYAPAFSSMYGPVRYDNIPFGLLLSANNPKTVTRYIKNGNDWEEKETSTYSYQYGENNDPVSISGNGLSLVVEYK